MRDRVGAWIRWLAVPWAPFAVAAAIIGAAAAPALLVSAASVWQVGATDDFAERLTGDLSPAESGITVATNAVFRPGPWPAPEGLVPVG